MAADNMYIADVDGDDDDKRLLVKPCPRAAVDELLLHAAAVAAEAICR